MLHIEPGENDKPPVIIVVLGHEEPDLVDTEAVRGLLLRAARTAPRHAEELKVTRLKEPRRK